MSDAYLDLYKLQVTGNPFQVERIIDDVLQSSPDCQVPEEVPLLLNLPVIDLELPELECKFDLDVPLIPIPYICTPEVTGTVSVSSCSDDVTVNSDVALNPVGDCSYELSGTIDICAPGACVPNINSNVFVVANNLFAPAITVTTPEILLTYDPLTCQYDLLGEVVINSDIKCIELFSSAVITTQSNSPRLTIDNDLNLAITACEMALTGTINIDTDVECAVYTAGPITVDYVDDGGPVVLDGYMNLIVSGCEVALDGLISISSDIACPSGITFTTPAASTITHTVPVVGDATMSISLAVTGGISTAANVCAKEITLVVTPTIEFNNLDTQEIQLCDELGGSETITVVTIASVV